MTPAMARIICIAPLKLALRLHEIGKISDEDLRAVALGVNDVLRELPQIEGMPEKVTSDLAAFSIAVESALRGDA